MATLTHSYASLRIFDRFSEYLSDLRVRYAQYKTYRITLNELQSLSQRELDDLGLHRSMIKDVAHNAAYGT